MVARVTPRPSWDDFEAHEVSSQIPAESWAPRVTRGAARQVLVAQVQRSQGRQVQRCSETGCSQTGVRFIRKIFRSRFELDASHPGHQPFSDRLTALTAHRIALLVSVRLWVKLTRF